MVMIRIQGELRARLRLRLGQEACIIFDQLLRSNCLVHKKPEKPSVTFPSGGSYSRSFCSSGRSSTCRSVSMQDQAEQELAEATKVTTELKKLGLSQTEFISAVCELMDDKKKNFFLALDSDELRKMYVMRLING